MTLKQLGVIALAFATGIAITSLFHYSGEPVAPASTEAGVVFPSEASMDRMRTAYEKQIADLKSQLDSASLLAPSASGGQLEPLTVERKYALFQELWRGNLEEHKKQENEKLLAAGFTMDRIEWLRRRSDELAAEWIQTDDRMRREGKLDAHATVAHIFDKDIDLRKELGDDEYARYRQALGRGVGLTVSEPIAGGIAARAGIQPGDQIIAYNGVRVFNVGELAPLTGKYATSGTSNVVDVLRNGTTIRLSAEGGDLRIRQSMPLLSAGEVESRMRADIGKIRQQMANPPPK